MKRLVLAALMGSFVMIIASSSSANVRGVDRDAPSCKPNGATCSGSSECCGGWCVSTRTSSSRTVCASHG